MSRSFIHTFSSLAEASYAPIWKHVCFKQGLGINTKMFFSDSRSINDMVVGCWVKNLIGLYCMHLFNQRNLFKLTFSVNVSLLNNKLSFLKVFWIYLTFLVIWCQLRLSFIIVLVICRVMAKQICLFILIPDVQWHWHFLLMILRTHQQKATMDN